jgi:hypothetical protein
VETQVRNLVLWNRFWVFLFVMTVLALVGRSGLDYIDQMTLRVSSNWDENGVRLSGLEDGPVVVTAIECLDERSWASLSKQIVITDSGGAYITVDQMKKLEWHDRQGQPCPFPGKHDNIVALYFRPAVTSILKYK